MFLFQIIDYPEAFLEPTPTSPPAIPTTLPVIQQSSPYEDWSHLIGTAHESFSPPPPTMTTQSSETTYPTEDPIFTDIYNNDLDWKNDHSTELAWSVWRHFDNALRIMKDDGYQIPNLVNNAYNISRDLVIDDYIARFSNTDNTPPDLGSFVPFPHNAERANANYVHPTNTPESEASSSSEFHIACNASTLPLNPEIDPVISNLIDPSLH
jgi:hypothetical protein